MMEISGEETENDNAIQTAFGCYEVKISCLRSFKMHK